MTCASTRWSLPLASGLLLLSLLHSGSAELNATEFAVKYAPYLRFDQAEGNGDRCYPHHPQDFYDARQAGDWSRQCNLDYNTVANAEIPTYWHAMECGYHLHIAYWNFYGYNHECDGVSGERDAWWEYTVIKIRDWELDPRMHEVMFGQKDGWYTRISGRYQVHEHTHPVAYVGKNNHGTYHDDGGSGTCCYYEDYRNPGDPNKHMKTWENLVEMSVEDGEEEWMSDPGTDYWHGLYSPPYRSNWDLCNLSGCKGSSVQVCWTCGCSKSDIGDDPF